MIGTSNTSISVQDYVEKRQLADAKAVSLSVIATKNPCERYAIGVPHHVTLGIFPNEGPGRLDGEVTLGQV